MPAELAPYGGVLQLAGGFAVAVLGMWVKHRFFDQRRDLQYRVRQERLASLPFAVEVGGKRANSFAEVGLTWKNTGNQPLRDVPFQGSLTTYGRIVHEFHNTEYLELTMHPGDRFTGVIRLLNPGERAKILWYVADSHSDVRVSASARAEGVVAHEYRSRDWGTAVAALFFFAYMGYYAYGAVVYVLQGNVVFAVANTIIVMLMAFIVYLYKRRPEY